MGQPESPQLLGLPREGLKPPGLPGFSQIPPQPLQPQASGTPQGGLILLPSFLGCSRTAWTPACLDFYPGETCSEGPQMWPSTNMGCTGGGEGGYRFSSPSGLQDGLAPLQPLEFPWGSSDPKMDGWGGPPSTPVRPQGCLTSFLPYQAAQGTHVFIPKPCSQPRDYSGLIIPHLPSLISLSFIPASCCWSAQICLSPAI